MLLRQTSARACHLAFATLAVLIALALPGAALSQSPATGSSAITGRVTDKDAGNPIPLALIDVIGTPYGAQGGQDGSFRIAGVATGVYRVRARRLGYQPTIVDSVRVVADSGAVVSIGMTASVAQLSATKVEAAANSASDAGMMAMQRSAAAVLDGVSAQAIARTPGSNAAEAITRVTGVSVVDKKFTIVRGLPERYSNTLLNGVELASPEPLRKIVPLDIFPASLLESIVASKTATPDKPGDFAGGSVEISTKEFPEKRVIQFNLSQEWNSQATFQRVGYAPLRGMSWLGFSGDRAAPTRPAPGTQDIDVIERFAESLRAVWTPRARTAPPGLGLGLGIGDRIGRLGYTVSLTYSGKVDHQPGRLYQFVSDSKEGIPDRGFIAHENQSLVDWGGTANLSVRLGNATKVGWKNLYTRNAEENVALNEAFETYRGPERVRSYQVRFVERELVQTQLNGDHLLGLLANTRFEWKATAARARRDEPDNRSATYIEDLDTSEFAMQSSQQSFLWFRFLNDQVLTGQTDLSKPLRIWRGRDALVKVGGLYREKDRRFTADVFTFRPSDSPPSGVETFRLPPERAFAPEHVGALANSDIAVSRLDALALPYKSADNLSAYYAMLDLPLLTRLRIVGGARSEYWMLDVAPASGVATIDSVTQRRELDILGSVNVTVNLTSWMNLRLAGYQTVARPDPRELTSDYYTPVTGECGNKGSADLRHTRIKNADFRLEVYPGEGEIVAVSGFYKQFALPVIEVVSLPQSTTCEATYVNAESATNEGLELEMRKSLHWLPLLPEGLFGNLNATLVRTEARLGARYQNLITRFQGQSPYVVNAGLLYSSREGGVTASLAGNAFGDRIARYGATSLELGTGTVTQIPHVVEQGRFTLDAKVQARVSRRVSWTLSARNLTNAAQQFYQDSETGRVRTGYIRTGASVKVQAGVEF